MSDVIALTSTFQKEQANTDMARNRKVQHELEEAKIILLILFYRQEQGTLQRWCIS